ncbi:MAG: glycosyltransferase [Erysipelotrichaceae bacterium]|nr:glycosyltransferase [Erysipelotrichaceae bacterium]
MKFSIVFPVYNVERYITKCLESVKGQTLEDFECLIIDDGTKDRSVEAAQAVIGNDKRFKIYHKENGGLSDARNYGMARAEGDYILLLDSDDYIDPSLLEKTYEMAMKHDSDIVCFDMMYVYDDHEAVNKVSMDKEMNSYKDDPGLIFIDHSANNKIYRREFLKDKSFIKGLWYEDLATIPTWIAKANNVSYVNEPLYFYVQRSGSISHSEDPRIFDIYKAINNLKKELNTDEKALFDFYYNDCLVMTTLRIREITEKKTRKEYFKTNAEHLNRDCPKWYEWSMKKKSSLKQKVVFFLLKHGFFDILNLIY